MADLVALADVRPAFEKVLPHATAPGQHCANCKLSHVARTHHPHDVPTPVRYAGT